MNKLNPWKTGVALVLALAVLYAACAGACRFLPWTWRPLGCTST